MYFTQTLWPDFRDDEFLRAIEWFRKRERRFGGLITRQNTIPGEEQAAQRQPPHFWEGAQS
jgi:hypothetical protein